MPILFTYIFKKLVLKCFYWASRSSISSTKNGPKTCFHSKCYINESDRLLNHHNFISPIPSVKNNSNRIVWFNNFYRREAISHRQKLKVTYLLRSKNISGTLTQRDSELRVTADNHSHPGCHRCCVKKAIDHQWVVKFFCSHFIAGSIKPSSQVQYLCNWFCPLRPGVIRPSLTSELYNAFLINPVDLAVPNNI